MPAAVDPQAFLFQAAAQAPKAPWRAACCKDAMRVAKVSDKMVTPCLGKRALPAPVNPDYDARGRRFKG